MYFEKKRKKGACPFFRGQREIRSAIFILNHITIKGK